MNVLSDAIRLFEKQQYEKAYSIFLPLAIDGDPTAEHYIGMCFRKGLYVNENQKEAFKWFLRSAEHGFLESQYIVGVSYSENPGFAGTPLSEAENNQFEAKMNDNPHYIPFFYCDGVGVEPDNDKSFEWMVKAAAQGHIDAINRLPSYVSLDEISKENRTILYKWIHDEVQKENCEAVYVAGEVLRYEWGKLKEALNSYKKAYEIGCMKAIDRIGELYENEEGEIHDYREAFKWYTLGAEKHNFVFSQYRLGHLYRTGHGVTKDLAKAIEWFKMAVNNSYRDSAVYAWIGKLYQQLGNDKEAINWYLKGAERFDHDSEARLLEYYANRFDVGEKYNSKFKLYEKAQSGDEAAQLEYARSYAKLDDILDYCDWVKFESIRDNPDLQEMYIDHFINSLNLDDDLKYWEFLANLGNSYAQYRLANRLSNESSIEYNPEKALYWYKIASTHSIDAQISMGYFYAHGILVDIDYHESYERYQDVAKKMLELKDTKLIRKCNYRKLKYNSGNDEAEGKALCNDVNAMLYMGCLYQHGFEIQQDHDKAIYWYEMATKYGSRKAKEQLEIIGKKN